MSRERAFQVGGAASGAKARGWMACLGTAKGAMRLAQRACGFCHCVQTPRVGPESDAQSAPQGLLLLPIYLSLRPAC